MPPMIVKQKIIYHLARNFSIEELKQKVDMREDSDEKNNYIDSDFKDVQNFMFILLETIQSSNLRNRLLCKNICMRIWSTFHLKENQMFRVYFSN
jgi:histidinol-phosphate/aromatic aminotransferase/cobyric acid decarboxylase-like protein